MTREASRNDFPEQHCLRIISKKYYSMLKFDAVALDIFILKDTDLLLHLRKS